MKLTQEQLASRISEPEIAIIKAEEGVLPENGYTLAEKLENFLRIKIVKRNSVEKAEDTKKELKFEPEALKDWTIADLKNMKDGEEHN